MKKHIKSIGETTLLCIALLGLWAPAFGQGGPPPTITAYSLGKAELDLHLWPAQISLRIPLTYIEQSLRDGLAEAGRNSPEISFGVKEAHFNFSPESPILSYQIDIEGKTNSGPLSIPFRCTPSFTFAIPASSVFDTHPQLLTLDPVCNVSGEGANLFHLNYLLEDALRIGITSAIGRTMNGPGNENQERLSLMKSDPELAFLLDRGKLQAKYCASPRWPRALCFHISWRSMDMLNYLDSLPRNAPRPLGPIDSSFDAAGLAKQFSDVGPQKPRPPSIGGSFPTKLHKEGWDGCQGIGCYDDGDAVIFNGLLCISGELLGCDTVRASQDDSGRFWRSPDRIGSAEINPFSGDQLKGVIAYLIRTSDKFSLRKFLSYVSTNKVPVPESGNAFDSGYKSCSNDKDLTCLLGAGDWYWLNKLASIYHLEDQLPSDVQDVAGRFGYGPDLLPWQAGFSPFGFETHLVGIEILFAQMLGIANDKHEQAAAILAVRQPRNPFFLYLHLGKDKLVLNQLQDKCTIDPNQTSLDQWAWERDQSKEEWKNSMRWDCAFMYRLLAMPSNLHPN